jgi:hypothetical protein
VVTAVDLHQNLDRGTRMSGERPRALGRVDADRDACTVRQGREPRPTRGIDPQGVRDEQIVEAGVGEHLGLGHRRDRQPDRAGGDLEPGDVGALVGLRVGSQRHAPGPCGSGHPLDVAVEHFAVDQEHGGGGDGVEQGHPRTVHSARGKPAGVRPR